jgi:hypothetical protein
MHQRVKEVAETFGDKVSIVEIEANKSTLKRYGTANGILVNGKRKLIGPASDEEIHKAIQEEITTQNHCKPSKT